jgi:hypothetical protein
MYFAKQPQRGSRAAGLDPNLTWQSGEDKAASAWMPYASRSIIEYDKYELPSENHMKASELQIKNVS